MISTRAVISLCILSAMTMFCTANPLSAETKKATLRLHRWHGYAKPYIEEFRRLVKDKHNVDVDLRITNASNPSEFRNMQGERKSISSRRRTTF